MFTKYIVYSERPKSEHLDFGAFSYSSVVEFVRLSKPKKNSFGCLNRTSENRTNQF